MAYNIVGTREWLNARRAFMEKEKAFQKARDALAAERRELPWLLVDKDYVFEGPDGRRLLSDLFKGRSQLIVWHFMFGADWKEGCPFCSFWADQYSPGTIHLEERDVSLVAVSTAPVATLSAYKKRMGWVFEWVSAGDNGFNADFAVSFTQEEISSGEMLYNFNTIPAFVSEMPGLSVFFKDEGGKIYLTYSTFARGLDPLNSVYQMLDLVPKGRDEKGLPHTMSWVRRHDQYRKTT